LAICLEGKLQTQTVGKATEDDPKFFSKSWHRILNSSNLNLTLVITAPSKQLICKMKFKRREVLKGLALLSSTGRNLHSLQMDSAQTLCTFLCKEIVNTQISTLYRHFNVITMLFFTTEIKI